MVYPSEAAFLADGHEPGIQIEEAASTKSIESTEPRWHRAAKSAYGALFFIVWLGFVGYFYYSGTTFRDGSPVLTAAQNEPITDHGKTVYITHDQKALRDKLELFGFVGISSVLVCGLLLHFLAGVKVFSETSTSREPSGRKSSGY